MQLPPSCIVLFGISSKPDELLLFKEINVFISLISVIGMFTILGKDVEKYLCKILTHTCVFCIKFMGYLYEIIIKCICSLVGKYSFLSSSEWKELFYYN